MKKYCPKPYHQYGFIFSFYFGSLKRSPCGRAHHEDMKKAKASDEAVVALMRKVKNALQEQVDLFIADVQRSCEGC